MENDGQFFEINELSISDEFSANMVMVENNGQGTAYLGWCENLAMDTAPIIRDDEAAPDSVGATEPGVLVLPFADIGILAHQGSPIPAPVGWPEMVVRPLAFQDYLLVMIETQLELNVASTS